MNGHVSHARRRAAFGLAAVSLTSMGVALGHPGDAPGTAKEPRPASHFRLNLGGAESGGYLVEGKLQLTAVPKAGGIVLHANLSATSADNEATGGHYRCTGAQQTAIPPPATSATWSPTFDCHAQGSDATVVLTTNLGIAFDGNGAIRSGELRSVDVAGR